MRLDHLLSKELMASPLATHMVGCCPASFRRQMFCGGVLMGGTLTSSVMWSSYLVSSTAGLLAPSGVVGFTGGNGQEGDRHGCRYAVGS